MKTTPTAAAKGLDRVRGLVRAAWSRLQRDDLGNEESAAAQLEYEHALDDLQGYGLRVVILDDQTLVFADEDSSDDEYDPELLVESMDGSGDPRPLRTLIRVVEKTCLRSDRTMDAERTAAGGKPVPLTVWDD